MSRKPRSRVSLAQIATQPAGQPIDPAARELAAGSLRAFGTRHTHRVTNDDRAAPAAPPPGRSIDDILAEARGRLQRVSPAEARRAWRDGAVAVDIRPEAQRRTHGSLPGALVVERNVLEWRFDPARTLGCRSPASTCRWSCSARRATRPAWPLRRCRTWACTAPPT